MAGVRKTVGIYEKPEKRGINPRAAVLAIVVALAAACGAAAIFIL